MRAPAPRSTELPHPRRAVLLVAEEQGDASDDVDRTDFTEEHLKEDKKPYGPHKDVEPASLLPDLAEDGSARARPRHAPPLAALTCAAPARAEVPLGVETVLLCALANTGPKMFNVTAIEGYLADAATGKRLKGEGFPRFEYGEPLGPREQRTFRYAFTPDAELAPKEYRLIFKAYYADREKDVFSDIIYNDTAQLVPPPADRAALLLYGAVGLGGLLVLAAGSQLIKGSGAPAGARPSKKAAGKTPDSSDSEWLDDTCVSFGAAKKKKRA